MDRRYSRPLYKASMAAEYFDLIICAYYVGYRAGTAGINSDVNHVFTQSVPLGERVYDIFTALESGIENSLRMLPYEYLNKDGEEVRWIELNEAIHLISEFVKEKEYANNDEPGGSEAAFV